MGTRAKSANNIENAVGIDHVQLLQMKGWYSNGFAVFYTFLMRPSSWIQGNMFADDVLSSKFGPKNFLSAFLFIDFDVFVKAIV